MNDFLFDLPKNRIAMYPTPVRSQSRLMVLNKNNGSVAHNSFRNLANYLRKGDLLVFNNSRVIPARLFAQKETGSRVEVFVERIIDDTNAWVLLRSNGKLSIGNRLYIKDKLSIEIEIKEKKDPLYRVTVSKSVPIGWQEIVDTCGRVPLPPYIDRKANAEDSVRYQTVYATHSGSVAAPTAGLHFDDHVFAALQEKSVDCAWLSLHVGYGTFAPLRSADVDSLHSERFCIDEDCCQKIRETKAKKGRVIAVGTTTTRVLETLALNGNYRAQHAETNIFIKPGFRFSCVDALITNFHLPASSLMYLVAAFAGETHIRNAYQEAITKEYRFYSYGDSMFIC